MNDIMILILYVGGAMLGFGVAQLPADFRVNIKMARFMAVFGAVLATIGAFWLMK